MDIYTEKEAEKLPAADESMDCHMDIDQIDSSRKRPIESQTSDSDSDGSKSPEERKLLRCELRLSPTAVQLSQRVETFFKVTFRPTKIIDICQLLAGGRKVWC